jgi:Holliday junction resolvasome RuvABC DNA-binding subunit
MIAYLRGPILRRNEEVVVVEAGGVGYEVHLPAVWPEPCQRLMTDPRRRWNSTSHTTSRRINLGRCW